MGGNRERLWCVGSKYGINHGIIDPWFYNMLINIDFMRLKIIEWENLLGIVVKKGASAPFLLPMGTIPKEAPGVCEHYP